MKADAIILRRFAALALLALLACLIGLAVIGPFIWLANDYEAEIAEAHKMLGRYRTNAAQQTRVDAEFKALSQNAANFPSLFKGATAALAGASMQAEIKRLVESQGCDIQSLQGSTPVAAGNTEKIEIKVDFSCPAHLLPQVIFAFENNEPFLLLTKIDISSPEFQTSDNPSPVKVSNRWTVAGYRWVSQS